LWKILLNNENKNVSRGNELLESDLEKKYSKLVLEIETTVYLYVFKDFTMSGKSRVQYILMFLTILTQRSNDNFVQNWYERLYISSTALFIANLEFQSYLDIFTANKMCQAMIRLQVSSHRL
jgi:hypothetical protein